MLWQGRSIRKVTGGRYAPLRGKRRTEIGRAPAETHIGEDRLRAVRTCGGNVKIRALRATTANVADRASGAVRRVAIETVEQNTANPNYVRRNLLTKGAIIRTELGPARIVSRPGQDGAINAVLIE
ncbi:MAG: 30S ribosomal protein S8e [Methanospirillum sp.]|nr:30S ribosomal protein S8e [Methanospirillum sp.]